METALLLGLYTDCHKFTHSLLPTGKHHTDHPSVWGAADHHVFHRAANAVRTGLRGGCQRASSVGIHSVTWPCSLEPLEWEIYLPEKRPQGC